MHEYMLALRAFSPSLRRLLLANALITAVETAPDPTTGRGRQAGGQQD